METTVYQLNISIFHKSLDLLISSTLNNNNDNNNNARSKNYGRGGRMSHASDFKVSYASFDVCGGELSCNKITLPCLLAHSGRFSINA